MKRKLIRMIAGLSLVALAVAALAAVAVETGMLEREARALIVKQIERRTGGRVELGAFHFRLRGLRAELDDFTLHGRESPGLPPLFHADQIRVGVHILSLLRRKVALEDLQIERPSVFLRVGEDGRSNIPVPQISHPRGPWRERLFDLRIAHLRLDDGTLEINDARVPLAAEGENFQFAMDFDAPAPGKESYVGQVRWQQMQFAMKRYLPFRSDVAARFTLSRDSFSLDDLRWQLPHSAFLARAEVTSFQPLAVNFHFRGQLALSDLRAILRKPGTPDGEVAFAGNGSYVEKMFRLAGHYAAQGIALHFRWFHAGGIESWGDYNVAHGQLVMPAFQARALGGSLEGRLEMQLRDLAFRTVSRERGASLAAVLASVTNPDLPAQTLHWDGRVDVDSTCTWLRDFKHFRAQGETRWSPPAAASPGILPATAKIDFDYSMDRHGVKLAPSEITTPETRIAMQGVLGERDSSLAVGFSTSRLADWDDFIAYLRGPKSKREAISGSAEWQGKIAGPLRGPTFSGDVRVHNARYGRLYWDAIAGHMDYSPDEFHLAPAVVRRGRSLARLRLRLELDGSWGFPPDAPWSLAAHLHRASTDDLQGLLGTAYPAHAVLDADFQGGGTRADPALDGTFRLDQGEAWGFAFDRASGRLRLRPGEIRIADASIAEGSGRIGGNLLYRPDNRQVEFALTGSAIALDKIRYIQTRSLPIAGRLYFDLRGKGPLLAPVAQGTVRLENLQFGKEILDSFAGEIDSDGRQASLGLHSTKTAGKLEGQLRMGLGGDYPLSGEFRVKQIDLDPFIIAGLRLKELTGHSSIDGRFSVAGPLRQPHSIVLGANLSRASFHYEYVKLENEGPVVLSYRRDEVRIEQADLRGPDTSFRISGDARFAGDRPLNLDLSGAINLRLATGLFPGLDARGSAQVDATIGGTFFDPQIIGQARISDASAHYGDFPAGLSHMNGEIVFDRNRLTFDNVAAKAGGGDLTLAGSLDYGEGPLHYEVRAMARQVRIRYPEGLSWLLDGRLRFSGTTSGALLSGNVAVDHLLFGQGVDFASLILASQETLTVPSPSSAYLRNLQFDLEAETSPGARIEWAGAHFTAEGSVRIRGTWEHPIVLGHLHLLAGEMSFRGNTYQLTRGDVDFSNPFRFDPVLNVEAVTTINPYEITLDFSGPASRMQLSYRSDPPLPASDIIALLALGSPGEESALRSTTATQAQNFGATALLSEAISSQLGGPIERLFGISHFRVDPFLAEAGSQQNAAARVTVQQQLTHDLSVTYSTNATANQQQVIEVDYAIRRNVSLVALRDINGTFGIHVKFTKHFK